MINDLAKASLSSLNFLALLVLGFDLLEDISKQMGIFQSQKLAHLSGYFMLSFGESTGGSGFCAKLSSWSYGHPPVAWRDGVRVLEVVLCGLAVIPP